MKKILFATNILLLGIIAFQACNSRTSTVPSPCSDTCFSRFCRNYPIENLNGKIRGDLIRSMSEDYAADLGKGYITVPGLSTYDGPNPNLVHGSKRTRDALSVVFDIEKLKTLISKMDKDACDRKCDLTKELGIRFYFVKYPSLAENVPEDLGGIPRENSFKHSLVMVPAYKDKNNPLADWYDYNLWSLGGCFQKIPVPNKSEFQFWGIGPDPGDNHGGIGPPPDPGTFPTNN